MFFLPLINNPNPWQPEFRKTILINVTSLTVFIRINEHLNQ